MTKSECYSQISLCDAGIEEDQKKIREWEEKDRAGEELIKELQNHVKKVTAPYKYPRVIEFVEELPKTISGKIRRVEIRDKDRNN